MRADVRLLLIRHAEPEETSRGRCYGRLDVPLSASGRAAAARLGDALAGTRLAAVLASPRRRATETAAALAERHALTVQIDDDLRELDFGSCEGRSYQEIEADHPELFRRWMESPTTVHFPGGESFALLQARALAAAERTRSRHGGQTVALVAHGGVLRAILADCLQMPAEAIFRLDLAYTGISVVDWIDGVPLVRSLNGTGLP
jgi:alpha-ribazole phosphatase